MEIARVVELYVPDPSGGGQIGSGYRLTEELVLTAGHVVTALPTHPPDTPVPNNVHAAGVCQARPLDEQAWTVAAVAWRDQTADVAVLRLAASAAPLPPGSPAARWGRVDSSEPIAVSAVGFPWAQERPDQVRDSEHLFGFLAPASQAKAGQLAVTVLTSPPAARDGGSPWTGMSGAALFTGPFLVAVVIVDPGRFGTDRVMATPLAPLLAEPALATLLDTSAPLITPVGPRLRLAVTADTSIAVAPPYRAASGRLGREPSRLLLPEYGIVPFLGRDTELQTLQEWCLTGSEAALRLLLGAGGAGKTRLATEACVRMAGHGWQAGLAAPNTPGGEPVLAFDRATLLVVDDADLHVDLLEKLVHALGYWPPDAPPVRLLLLARHPTGWWDTLTRRTHRLAAELADAPLTMHNGELPADERAAHHAAAVTAFTPHLHNPPAAACTSPDLSGAAFTNPLLVHMHALLAVAGADLPTTGAALREHILASVLDEEETDWETTFPPHVPLSDATNSLRQVIATATLFAPPDHPGTTALLTLVTDLADASAVERRSVANWLHKRYPGAEPPWAAPLRPDLLAEQLLATCPDLSNLVLAGYEQVTDHGADQAAQVEQVLTELTRAAGRDRVRQTLDRLLAGHLSDLLDAAIADPAGRLPDLLDRALTTCPQSQAAALLADQLPEHSTGLARLAATLTAQAVDHHRALASNDPDPFTPDLARSLNSLSVRLGELGRAEDALSAIEDATATYRTLTQARPGAYASDLAMSLNNLSLRLADLGRREEALTAIEEATDRYRNLAAARPDAHTPDLARSLNNLSGALADLGRREEALSAIEEAVTLRRALAAARPDAYTPALAEALQSYGNVLTDLGRDQDALAADQECVTLLRGLYRGHPNWYRDALAAALHKLAIALRTVGNEAAAEQVEHERAALGD